MAQRVEWYFQRYGDLELHRRMISDRSRTDAFAKAIAEVVRSTDRVLDLGTGTGILAMLAAKAGAKKVDAIDRANIADVARHLVKANKLTKKVTIHKGLADELVLDHKVDVLVSEWLGHFALVEGMLDDLCALRDRHLVKGGRLIPSRVQMFLAPVDDPVLYMRDGPGYWREPVRGLDFSSLEKMELDQGRAIQLRIDPSTILSESALVRDLDMATVQPDDPWGEGRLKFDIKRDGVLGGFGAWFSAQLSDSVLLHTAPGHPDTHWMQSYMAFPPMIVRRGDKLSVRYDLSREPHERRQVRLSLTVGRKTQRYVLE